MFEVYKPSGRVGVMTWPLLIVGLIIMAALAFVYQLLLVWIPLIYANALLTVGMGYAAGLIGAFIVTKGHCRSMMMATVIGLLLATSGLGAKFLWQYRADCAEWIELLETTNEIAEADKPQAIATFKEEFTFLVSIEDRVGEGWLIGNGGGAPIAGVFVYIIWAIEAGTIFFFAWTMTRDSARNPYSEKMSLWADEAEAVMLLPIDSDEMVSQIQAARSVDQLLEIPIPKTDDSAKLAQYIVNSIPGQEMEDAYLTVKTIEYSINKKGEQETKETALVENAILSSEQRKQLVENAELLNEAMDEFRASVRAERLAEREGQEAGGETSEGEAEV